MICLPIYKWGSMVSYSSSLLKTWTKLGWDANNLPSRITKMSFLWNIYYLYITEPRSAISQKSHTKWILHQGKQTSDWKGFHAWMLAFCSCLDIMAATFLYIIKGTGVCHLHQTLASPREPLEKASAVTVETSSFLDVDPWRLRQPWPKRGLV